MKQLIRQLGQVYTQIITSLIITSLIPIGEVFQVAFEGFNIEYKRLGEPYGPGMDDMLRYWRDRNRIHAAAEAARHEVAWQVCCAEMRRRIAAGESPFEALKTPLIMADEDAD